MGLGVGVTPPEPCLGSAGCREYEAVPRLRSPRLRSPAPLAGALQRQGTPELLACLCQMTLEHCNQRLIDLIKSGQPGLLIFWRSKLAAITSMCPVRGASCGTIQPSIRIRRVNSRDQSWQLEALTWAGQAVRRGSEGSWKVGREEYIPDHRGGRWAALVLHRRHHIPHIELLLSHWCHPLSASWDLHYTHFPPKGVTESSPPPVTQHCNLLPYHRLCLHFQRGEGERRTHSPPTAAGPASLPIHSAPVLGTPWAQPAPLSTHSR